MSLLAFRRGLRDLYSNEFFSALEDEDTLGAVGSGASIVSGFAGPALTVAFPPAGLALIVGEIGKGIGDGIHSVYIDSQYKNAQQSTCDLLRSERDRIEKSYCKNCK